MRPTQNLQRRSNGVFYFRYYVPTDLVGRFQRRELIFSLRTRNLRAARYLAEILRIRAHKLMAVIRQNQKLTAEELEALAKRYFEWNLKRTLWDTCLYVCL